MTELAEARELRREAAYTAQIAIRHREVAANEEAEAAQFRREASSRLEAVDTAAKQVGRLRSQYGYTMPEAGDTTTTLPSLASPSSPRSFQFTSQGLDSSTDEVRRIQAALDEEVQRRMTAEKERD